jgi:hypothetical protein
MAKAVGKVRGKFLDEKHLGPEPVLVGLIEEHDLGRAYNWFNYFYSNDDAKEFALAYLKHIKYDRKKLKLVNQISAQNLRNIGWHSRLAMNGSEVSQEFTDRILQKVEALIVNEVEVAEVIVEPVTKNVISIQDRINEKTSNLIGDLEEQIDIFIKEGRNSFNIEAWMRANDIKPQIAQRIADYYKPLYAELFDAMQGKDPQLKEAYSRWKKIQLKSYTEFVRGFVSAAEARATVIRAARKPRKKKEKPAGIVVGKMKYLAEDTTFNIKSIKPTEVVGAQQLWVFNVKYRNLSVYNAMSHTGLSVKGTTITGFDEKTSVTKKLRKPEQTLTILQVGSKVVLRKLMDNVKCKPKAANGRLNTEVVLLRAIK